MLQDIAILTVARSSARRSASRSRPPTSRCSVRPQGRHHQDETTIVEGAGDSDAIAGRVAQIRAEIENSDSDYDARSCRSACQAGRWCCVIKAGAATEVELKERKHRIEDAVRNAKAAVEEGIVAGAAWPAAGVPSLDELKLTGDEATGANIVRVALEAR